MWDEEWYQIPRIKWVIAKRNQKGKLFNSQSKWTLKKECPTNLRERKHYNSDGRHLSWERQSKIVI